MTTEGGGDGPAAPGVGRRDRPLRRLIPAPPTGRGLALILAALVPVALAVGIAPLLWPGLALTLAAVALVTLDALRAPAGPRLRARRTHPPTLFIGRAAPVVVGVEVLDTRTAVRAVVRDEHPLDVPASVEVVPVQLVPGSTTEIRYELTPGTRGTRRFGDLAVRVPGPLGLAMRQTTIDMGEDSIVVDPDLSSIRAFEALARRGQLAELGVRTIRRRGEGTEFERVREATPEDPLRSINWRATARTGRLMSSELIPERSQPVVICIDHGRLMGVGAGAMTKLDHALAAALLLAHVALRTGDRVALVAFADGITASVPLRGGRVHLGALLSAVRPLEPVAVDADYDALGEHLSRTHRRRSLIAIFTDVLDPDQASSLVAQSSRLGRRHLPLVITVRDPALDAASQRRPETPADVYERAVAGGMLGDRAAVLRTLRRAGADTIDADARALSPRLVNRYLELKRRGRL